MLNALLRARVKKEYRLDACRQRAPEETYRWIRPKFGRMGITRVADLTGLDRLGIPVCTAIRPMSRSLSASQGKGLTLMQAKVSAAMESIELYHAENIRGPVVASSYQRLRRRGPALDPETLWLCQDSPYHAGLEIAWLKGRDLLQGRDAYVPFELVSTDRRLVPVPAPACFAGSTNGLASGNHLVEAVLHGLLELVERDAAALSEVRQSLDGGRDTGQVDPLTVTSRSAQDILRRLDGAGLEARIFDLTSDIGVPVFQCVIYDREAARFDTCRLDQGYGCHLNPEVALIRAMTEAVQGRVGHVAGSRDTLLRAEYDRFLWRLNWWLKRAPAAARRDFRKAANLETARLDTDLKRLLALLKRRGIRSVVAVDLRRPELGIPVAKVIVPGLEQSPRVPRRRDGGRARALRARLA